MEKPKAPGTKAQGVAKPPVEKAPDSSANVRIPPLFRRVDWLALLVTALVLFVAYYLTIAPELTLEDSGELATASFYAGVPHPPGYPVWTMFTYLWTLLPFGNVAWRVALASAFAGAMAAGLLAMLVSRSSSMIIESIDSLKGIDRRWENLICLVSGFVSGGLIGFNGYMWSQSVIVEVYPLSVFSLMGVLVCMLRWVYAPRQRRYLYWAFFLYGICCNNHQTLLVIAMGMEVLAWMAEPKLGRELFFWNTLIYLVGLAIGPTLLTGNTPVFVIYNSIGISSALLWIWLSFKTKKTAIEFGRDAVMLALLGSVAAVFGGITHYLPAFSNGKMLFLAFVASAAACVGFVQLIRKTKKYSKEWLVTLACGGSWLVGAAFYLIEPIACMADPPMEWAYPRTVQGFIHAITRGQYERIHPTSGVGNNMFQVVGSFITTYGMQLWRYMEGLYDEFNVFYLLIALVIFLFYRQMKKRERVWVIGMVAIFVCLGPFLVLLLNFSSDRQSLELIKVFLTSSHVFIAMSVGYGLTLLAASLLTHYGSFRKIAILGGICAADFALFMLSINSQVEFEIDRADTACIYGFAKVLCWLLAFTCLTVLWRKGLERDRWLSIGVPSLFILFSFGITAASFFGDPVHFSHLAVVFHNIVHAFSPDQYGLPVFAGLILLGMSLVFLACAIVYRTKAPIGVALVLFAMMPSYSVLRHWFDNEQRDHWFGYWFGHDMFTPPFTAPDGKLSYDPKLRKQAMEGTNSDLVYPEMARNAILFGGTDPGRFCPTYMIFCDSFIPDSCKPIFDQRFDRRDVYLITQNALADGTYLQYLRAQYFRSHQKDPPFFQQLLRGPNERDQNYETNFIARIADRLLDRPLTAWGAGVEARRRREGVYPPDEIYIPSNEDSQQAFTEYTQDAERRMEHDLRYPNEPKELRAGEYVNVDTNTGRIQISGQVAVMAINGLLTKVIFDRNPTNQFYVEESFPLDWMFPHLTPFGIIMKLNRQTVPEITDAMARRDHNFWAKYSQRLIGNWITDKTSVKQIADWANQVYMRHDYSGFKGDLKFVRDNDAQKSFSKLRSAIGGIYAWRAGLLPGVPTPPQYLPKTAADRQRMIAEADFAYRQAFAFCPYSPEVMMRYVNLLITGENRLDDALLVAKTCLEFDPDNGSIIGMVNQLEGYKKAPNARAQIEGQIAQLESDLRTNPNDFQKSFELAQHYMQLQQTGRAYEVLDSVVNNPHATANVLLVVAQAYSQLNNQEKLEPVLAKIVKLNPKDLPVWGFIAQAYAKLKNGSNVDMAVARMDELAPTNVQTWIYAAQAYSHLDNFNKIEFALEKVVKLEPNQPETWYDLATVRAALGKSSLAVQDLRQCLELNAKRLAQNPKAHDLRAEAEKDPKFATLRNLPQYKALFAH